MYGTCSYGSQPTGAWTGAAADAPSATSEAGTVAWMGAAADAPAAAAPTMGFALFFSIAGRGAVGVFCGIEKVMGQERRLQ